MVESKYKAILWSKREQESRSKQSRPLSAGSRDSDLRRSHPDNREGGSFAVPNPAVSTQEGKNQSVSRHKMARKRMHRKVLKSQENEMHGNIMDSSCGNATSNEDRLPHMQGSMVSDEIGGSSRKRDAPKEKNVADLMAKLNVSDIVCDNVTGSSETTYPQKKRYQMHDRIAFDEIDTERMLEDKLKELPIERLFEQDEDGDNLLMLAVIQGYTTLALLLMNMVSSLTWLNLKNDLFQTALHMAVLRKNSPLVRELVTRGADVTAQDGKGNTPLHIACSHNDLSCVLALTTVITPRERESCAYRVSQMLPQRHDIYNYRGQTCLHIVAESGFHNLVQFLVESDFAADVNAAECLSGRTPLHLVAESGNKHLLKYFLGRKGLNLQQLTYAGHSALDLALGRGHKKVIDLLVRAGAQTYHVLTDNSDCSENDDEENLSIKDFEVQRFDSERSMEKSLQSLAEEMEYDDVCISGKCVSSGLSSTSLR